MHELAYNSVNDLHTKGLGLQLFFVHQLQQLVSTFQEKYWKFNWKLPCAGNRSQNRTAIHMQNCTQPVF
jgi:hypothetical protein